MDRPQPLQPTTQFVHGDTVEFSSQDVIVRRLDHPAAAEDGLEVQPAAADGDRRRSALPETFEGLEKPPLEFEDVELDVEVDDVDQMMADRHAPDDVLLQILAGTDVEAAVNLSRVDREDLGAGEASQGNPQPGLAGSRRTEDHQEILHRSFTISAVRPSGCRRPSPPRSA